MGERSGEGLRRGAGESFGDPAGKSVTCSGFRATSPASGFHSPEQDRKHPETQAGLTRPAEIPFSSAYGRVQGTGRLRVYGLWRSSTSPAQLSLRVRPPPLATSPSPCPISSSFNPDRVSGLTNISPGRHSLRRARVTEKSHRHPRCIGSHVLGSGIVTQTLQSFILIT